jgi:TonB family protein
MSDKNKNRIRKLADFFRYHRDELTGQERNAFERELQKDPFADEAFDGFSLLSPQDASKDISDIQKRIKLRSVRKQRFLIYRIAASVAVLVAISIMIVFIGKPKAEKSIADNFVRPDTLEITKYQPIAAQPATIESTLGQNMATDRKADKPASHEIDKKSTRELASSEIILKDEISHFDSVSEQRREPEKVSISEKRLASRAKVPSKVNTVKADSQVQTISDSSEMNLSEVVVTGYGVSRKESDKEESLAGYVPPKPVKGKADFDKYILNNLHRPDSISSGQRVVVIVNFKILADGSIDSIRIVRSPHKSFSDEAIRVIKTGPAWNPAEENGKKIEDKVRLRIVFR